MIPLHEQGSFTYFLRLNNSETFVELVGVRPLHLLSQTVLPLKSPTGAFIAALRFANAVYNRIVIKTRTTPPSKRTSFTNTMNFPAR